MHEFQLFGPQFIVGEGMRISENKNGDQLAAAAHTLRAVSYSDFSRLRIKNATRRFFDQAASLWALIFGWVSP